MLLRTILFFFSKLYPPVDFLWHRELMTGVAAVEKGERNRHLFKYYFKNLKQKN